MNAVLFVDDEPAVLNALRRGLHKHRADWRLCFVESGAEALNALAQERFDAVVCDLRMPGLDGAAVLEEVRTRQPDALRFVLSGYSDQALALRCVQVAHQHLAKPCAAEDVMEALQRSIDLRALCASESARRIVSTTRHLPARPQVYFEMVGLLAADEGSMAEAVALVKRDVALAAKVLQVVNSSFFGIGRDVTSIQAAVGLLGMDALKNLTLAMEVFVARPPDAHASDVQRVQDQGLLAARIAYKIALQHTRSTALADQAMTAALLADVGVLVLLGQRPPGSVGGEWLLATEQALGQDHMQIGACLLGTWGLPDVIVEAVAHHHRPAACRAAGFVPLTAVHVAHALCANGAPAGADAPGDGADAALDEGYLAAIGCADALPSWRAIAQQICAQSRG